MNINPFKRIADLEARIAQVEKQAAAAMATASTSIDVMAELPSIAVIEEAVALAKKSNSRLDQIRDRFGEDQIDLNTRVNYLEKENNSRKIGAAHLDKRISALDEDVVLLKALRNMVTPEEVSRQSIEAQLERDRAKQREYNAAYRARQKAKAEAAARKEKRLQYQRDYRARKQAEKAAQGAAK